MASAERKWFPRHTSGSNWVLLSSNRSRPKHSQASSNWHVLSTGNSSDHAVTNTCSARDGSNFYRIDSRSYTTLCLNHINRSIPCAYSEWTFTIAIRVLHSLAKLRTDSLQTRSLQNHCKTITSLQPPWRRIFGSWKLVCLRSRDVFATARR